MSTDSGVLFIPSCLLMLFGLLIVILGIVLWKKQKVTWASSHSNVKKKDAKAFTKMVGQCTIGCGISIILMGLFWAINQILVGYIAFTICVVVSLVIYFMAQSKYNS